MAYCTKCGLQVDGQFCPRCGEVTDVAPATPFAQRAAPGLGVNGASALCYLFGFVTGILFLLLAPYNRDGRVRFHAFQSIFLSVAVAVLQAGIAIVVQLLVAVSLPLGTAVGALLHSGLSLGTFLLLLYLMWKSYQGEKVVLPVIGELAERQVSGRGPDSPAGTMGKAA